MCIRDRVAGAALMATGVGAPLAAAIVGAGDFALTGSLKEGLMAGLGAWGGASLAEGLGSAGLEAAAQQGGDQAAAEFANTQATVNAGLNSSIPADMAAQSSGSLNSAIDQVNNMQNLTDAQRTALGQAFQNPNVDPSDIVRSAGAMNAVGGAGSATSLSNMGAGLSNTFSSGTNALNFAKANPGSVATVSYTHLTLPTILRV